MKVIIATNLLYDINNNFSWGWRPVKHNQVKQNCKKRKKKKKKLSEFRGWTHYCIHYI